MAGKMRDSMSKEDTEDTKRIYGTYGERFVRREEKNLDRIALSDAIIGMLGDIRGKKILDAGCGASRELVLMSDAGAEVSGIDITPEMISLAKKKCVDTDVKLYTRDMQKSGFSDKSFDIVISVFSVGYKKDLAALLKEFKRLLKPQGILLIAVVHPIRKMVAYTADYFRTGKHWEEWDNGIKVFNYYRTMEEYINTLAPQGFAIQEVREPKPRSKDNSENFYPHYLIIKAKS